MTDVLRIKRRTTGAPGAPSSLMNAELAYNEVDHVLYYGEGTGGAGGSATTVVPIGGTGQGSNSLPVMNGIASAGVATQWSRGDHIHGSDTSRAPINSPTFTGVPSAPTAPNGTNTTQIATTANVLATRLDQLAAPGANVTFNSKSITNLLDPVGSQDAATKAYVDAVVQGIDGKASVRAATTGAITLSGTQTIDGVALVVADRVLVKDQSPASGNGVYIVQSSAWTRAQDMDTWAEIPAAYVFVEQGTVNADTGWLSTADPGGTLNTTPITWTQFTSAGTANAGAGLTKTGNTIDVIGTAGQIIVNADSIGIDSTYLGQVSITTLGIIATGTWSANTIAVNKGGTGATTLTGYVKGNGTSAMTATATIPNADIAGLGTMATQNANAVAITGGTIDGITLDGGTF